MQRRILQELRRAPLDPGVRRFGEPGAELLDQARLAEARLADDHDELALALARALPAPEQHRHLVVAADERRQRPCAGPAAGAARAHDPKERRRLGHAFERMRAAILGDEQAGDLTLDARRDQHRSRLGERLHPRGDIGRVTEDFAVRIDHDRPGFDADPGDELRAARARIVAVQLGERSLDGERGANRALGIVLLRDRVVRTAPSARRRASWRRGRPFASPPPRRRRDRR